MKALTLAAIVSAVALSGCASGNDLNATLDTLARNYSHCDRTVNYSASIGALNPSSGAQVQGTVHCPPTAPATAPEDQVPVPPT